MLRSLRAAVGRSKTIPAPIKPSTAINSNGLPIGNSPRDRVTGLCGTIVGEALIQNCGGRRIGIVCGEKALGYVNRSTNRSCVSILNGRGFGHAASILWAFMNRAEQLQKFRDLHLIAM